MDTPRDEKCKGPRRAGGRPGSRPNGKFPAPAKSGVNARAFEWGGQAAEGRLTAAFVADRFLRPI
jgi:hypothetical protein